MVLLTGRFHLYSWVTHSAGVSFLVENAHTKALEYTQDCSSCRRVRTHRVTGFVHEELVPPGEMRLMHHLLCDGSGQTWSWGYKSSYLFRKV